MYPAMPYCPTYETQMPKKLPLETWSTVLGTTILVIRRLSPVKNKRGVMASNTSGWILAVSTSRTTVSFPWQSIPCCAGTKMRLDATCTCQVSQLLATRTACGLGVDGNRIFERIDGSLGAGQSKSFWHRHLSSSSHRMAGVLVTRSLSSNKSTK